MGILLRSCVEVRETIELSLRVVSGICGGMGVLDRGPHASRGKRFGEF